jgi:hypothetical protein
VPVTRIGMWVEITHPNSPVGGAWQTKRLEVVAELPAGDPEDAGQIAGSVAVQDALNDLVEQLDLDVPPLTQRRAEGMWRDG